MKRLSIKARVTLWFTLFLTLLAGLALGTLLAVGGQLTEQGSQNTLKKAVSEGLEELDWEDGRPDIDDDLKSYQDGVWLAVYDQTGSLVYGGLPDDLGLDQPFEEGALRTCRQGQEAWYLYDLVSRGQEGTLWLRGATAAQSANQTFLMLLRLALVALPFLVLAGALGGYAIANHAFGPVRRITRAAEQISDGQDLSRRIDLGPGRDEIYTLAATFDRMFARLEASFQAEKQFTSDASHELRTPVAVILAQCEEAQADPSQRDHALQVIQSQARDMSALIGQLLTLARADQGRLNLEKEPIDLGELTQMVAAQTEELAAAKGIRVECRADAGLWVQGDETMLVRMLLNLTENAVKYGREGGFVRITLSRQGDCLEGRVEDDGIGITPQQQERIWERFYQADPSRSPSQGGVGLGLPMVRTIVQAHGGRVWAESRPGGGSVFLFRLPALEPVSQKLSEK